MGRLTEHFGRLNQRNTRRNHSLPEHIDALCDRIRHTKVNIAKLAEREAREHMTAFPGPLQTPDDPPGCSARMKAARKATRLLMAMVIDGETTSLARRFDTACRVIDDEDGDLGPIIRRKVFKDVPTLGTSPAAAARADLQRTTVCKRIDGDMTIRTR